MRSLLRLLHCTFALLLLAPPAADAQQAPAGATGYTTFVRGNPIGREDVTVRSDTNGVTVTSEGRLTFEDGVSASGKYVEMRAEMDVLAIISNCPQLNNPCNAYDPTPVEVLIWEAGDR